MKLFIKILLGVSLNWFALPAYAAPGDLDTSFNVTGYSDPVINGNDITYGAAVQPDGKIVSIGRTVSGTSLNLVVIRHDSSGNLDNSFDFDGKLIEESLIEGLDVLVQPDGKIVVGGELSGGTMQIIRLNENGTRDTSFSSDGRIGISIGTYDTRFKAIALQSDKKILAVGYSASSALNRHLAIVRIDESGTLDTFFGNNGVVEIPVSSAWDVLHSVISLPDNSVVAAGDSDGSCVIVKTLASGQLDSNFGTNGIYIYPSTLAARCYAIGDQHNDKFLVGGSFYSGAPGWNFGVIRVNSDGSLDTSFGTNGISTWSSGTQDIIFDIEVQPDNKILVTGYPGVGVALARLLENGTLDTTFLPSGFGTLNVPSSASSRGQSIDLLPDGRIIVSAYAGSGWLVARLEGSTFDLVPDSINFTDISDQTLNTISTTPYLPVTGLPANTYVPVSVVNGEYSLNNGPYTSENAYVRLNDQVSLRHTSSQNYNDTITTTFYLGGYSPKNNQVLVLGSSTPVTFTSTTGVAPDTSTATASSGGGGGGSMEPYYLLILYLFAFFRRYNKFLRFKF